MLTPPGLMTVTSTVATLSAGAVAEILVLLLMVKAVAATVPKLTAVAPVKFVPVIVTTVPPENGPLFGERPVTEGTAKFTVTLKVLPAVALLASVTVTV